ERVSVSFQCLRLHTVGNSLQPVPSELGKPHRPRARDMVAPERSFRLPLQEDLLRGSAVLLARANRLPDTAAVCGDVVDEPDTLASPETRANSPHLASPQKADAPVRLHA